MKSMVGSQYKSQKSPSNDILPDGLFEDCFQVSVRDTQHMSTPRPLSIIEEEQSTPVLSEASGLSTKTSSSIHTNSISSFGSSSDNVHLLVDVDNEDSLRPLTMHNEECIPGTRMQSPEPYLEEPITRLSNRAAYEPAATQSRGVDPKVKTLIPVLLQSAESTRRYLPSKVLSKIRQYRTKESITVADLNQITSIADFLSAARSGRNAYRLYRFIFDRMVVQTDSSLSTLDIYLAGINVTRTAMFAENPKEIADLMINIMKKRNEPNTIEACLLHSHLGNNLRSRNELQAAEHLCRRGIDCYQRYHRSSNMHASQIILATNFLLVQEAKGEHVTQDHLLQYISIECTLRVTIEDTLLALLQWCYEAIVEDDLQALAGLIHGCNDELWTHGSANDLDDFETTLLFCHIWKRWRLADEGSQMSTLHHNCHLLLAKLETDLGIAPVDALAALSIMIMSPGGSEHHCDRTKPTSIRRILCASQAAFTKVCGRLFDFLVAHAAPLWTKFKSFSTETYAIMVEEFIRGFADLHLHLHLSEATFQDPRLRMRPNRSSVTTSMTPTTLSTPRSSWSGYSSFKLSSQRAKSAWSQIGSDVQSAASGPQRLSTSSSSLWQRLSALSGSFNGFRTSRSSSFMNAGPDDVIMEDII
jgi:hypothetical protein